MSDTERRANKVRTVKATLAALEHETFMKLLGQPYDAAKLERLGDELVALSHVEPYLSLAEVSR